MPITSVQYGKLKNLGNYENERLSVWVALAEGQTAEEALAEAKAFVDSKLGAIEEGTEHVRSLEEREMNLRRDISTLEYNLRQLKAKWDFVKSVLAANGIEPGPDPYLSTDKERTAAARAENAFLMQTITGPMDVGEVDDQDEDQDEDDDEEDR